MGIRKEVMKSRSMFLILICVFCIALTGWAFYIDEITLNHTVEINPPAQEPSPCIIHLDTFEISNEIIGNARIVIIHDDKRNVTCYLYNRMIYGGGISCVPNSEIQSSEIENNYKKYIAR